MRDDILKFRKLCEVLKKEKHYSQKQFCIELGISQGTFKNLLKEDIATIKPYSSVLGKVQDFIRKHINDLNYAGIKPDPETVNKLRKNLKNYQPDKQPEVDENKKPEPENPEPVILDLLKKLAELVPANVQIIINAK